IEKCNSSLLKASSDLRWLKVDIDAEGFHNIGRAALRGHAPVAVLGHAHTGAGDHEGGRGRNVEGATGVAAGAAGIEQGVAAGAAGVKNGVALKVEWSGGRTNCFGEPDNFLDGFALHVQRD